MESFDKLVKEHKSMIKKHTALYKFIKSKEFDELDLKNKTLLIKQLNAMNTYIKVLQARIDYING